MIIFNAFGLIVRSFERLNEGPSNGLTISCQFSYHIRMSKHPSLFPLSNHIYTHTQDEHCHIRWLYCPMIQSRLFHNSYHHQLATTSSSYSLFLWLLFSSQIFVVLCKYYNFHYKRYGVFEPFFWSLFFSFVWLFIVANRAIHEYIYIIDKNKNKNMRSKQRRAQKNSSENQHTHTLLNLTDRKDYFLAKRKNSNNWWILCTYSRGMDHLKILKLDSFEPFRTMPISSLFKQMLSNAAYEIFLIKQQRGQNLYI